jgi:intracellular septation protein A
MIRHLVRAVTPLFFDSLGMILFAVMLALHVSLVLASVTGVLLASAIVGWELARGQAVPPLQRLSLALVLLSAGATLFTGDPRFLMMKPTLIYVVIGTAMLQRGWMNRYVAPDHLAEIEDWMTRFGYVWATLMFATGLTNLVVALAFTAWWPLFVATFPLVSKLALFAVQFAIVYSIGRARGRRRQMGHDRHAEAWP